MINTDVDTSKQNQNKRWVPFFCFVFEQTHFCTSDERNGSLSGTRSPTNHYETNGCWRKQKENQNNRAIFALIPPCPPYPIGSSLQSLMAGPVSAAASAWHLARRHAGVKSKRITDDYCFLNEFEFQRSSRRKPSCNYIFTWSILIQFYSRVPIPEPWGDSDLICNLALFWMLLGILHEGLLKIQAAASKRIFRSWESVY